VKKFDLVLLEDDRRYFPQYLAAPLVRGELDERIKRVLNELSGKISEAEMRELNARILLEGKSFAEVARSFLVEKRLLQGGGTGGESGKWMTLLRRATTHIVLTLIALVAGMAIAIPFGVVVYWYRKLSRPITYLAGLLQTIPSIALLAFMIPFFGIGATPAIVALFLYALLPILRNTTTALQSIDPVLKKVSVGIGLTAWQRLRHIELPLAAPTILAGIKTAAVINIGTATLAAFIGAGGLGEPIVTGLALNNVALILEGAVPAAILAIITEFAFETLERLLIPKHLLQKSAE
jgi:osmoprotectant transport system permease protein